jgi:hypothetical protein
MPDRRSGRDPHFSAIETNTNKAMQEVYGTIIYRSNLSFLAAIYSGRGSGSVRLPDLHCIMQATYPNLDFDHVTQ